MEKSLHAYPGKKGLEIAISPRDLRVKAKCHILEKQSTSGFSEVPVIEYPDTFAVTNGMIQYDQPWCVEFKWGVYGPLACLLKGGYWKCEILFEQMGGGETRLTLDSSTLDLGVPGQEYESLINVQARSLRPGVYRVVCCLQYCFENGKPGPIAGFEDKGLIKIFEDKRIYANTSASNGSLG